MIRRSLLAAAATLMTFTGFGCTVAVMHGGGSAPNYALA